VSKGKAIAGTAAALATILAGIYAREGGFVDHPSDPGGATNHGVTQAVARANGYKGDMRHFPRHCAGSAKVCADEIYIKRFIKPMTGDFALMEADPAVSEELVDTAVNMGLPRPTRWFQQSLRDFGFPVAVDGKMGNQTIRAGIEFRAKAGPAGCVLMLDSLDARQRAEYDRIVRVRPASRVFYRGWIRQRIGNVPRSRCGEGL
jgi:lysozyme family protein